MIANETPLHRRWRLAGDVIFIYQTRGPGAHSGPFLLHISAAYNTAHSHLRGTNRAQPPQWGVPTGPVPDRGKTRLSTSTCTQYRYVSSTIHVVSTGSEETLSLYKLLFQYQIYVVISVAVPARAARFVVEVAEIDEVVLDGLDIRLL